ncbi:MAG: hypothetical protein U1F49_11085 [Rubrivivax sp.]
MFGVRDSLIVPYERHDKGTKAPTGRAMDGPWHAAKYDFVLAPA